MSAPPPACTAFLHSDRHVLVVSKPEGLLSVPGRGPDKADCLIARLSERWPDVALVHRLDRDTSGVMVFALTRAAQADLGRQFETRSVAKTYVARVHGHLVGAGRVDLPLIVDWPNRPRQRVDHDLGRPAQTDWQAIAHAPGETRVALAPITGRSHQLRVHMARIGHPILGDTLYADGSARAHPRLMLHALELAFDHPATGRRMQFRDECPF
jgi:tRNA pseudouridine32 synthase/23S rRNA pseudouridine746 synthase